MNAREVKSLKEKDFAAGCRQEQASSLCSPERAAEISNTRRAKGDGEMFSWASLALSRGNFYTGAMRFYCRTFFPAVLVDFLLLVCAISIGAAEAEKTIALKAARLFDGKSKALVTNGVVI